MMCHAIMDFILMFDSLVKINCLMNIPYRMQLLILALKRNIKMRDILRHMNKIEQEEILSHQIKKTLPLLHQHHREKVH